MAGKLLRILRTITRNSIFLHILFWVLSYFTLLSLFSTSSEISKVDHIYTAVFLLTLSVAVYINLKILVPKFLSSQKFYSYGALILIVLLIGSLFNILLFSRFIDYMLPGYYFISYYSFIDILKFFVVFIAITTLLKLSKEWFQLKEAKQKLAETEKEKVEIELKALRSQVNPHFLFNSLNVIYSLALKNSKDTPEIITRLSDILRYVLYDSNVGQIKLRDEVALIDNYLGIQKHRIDSSSQVVFNKKIKEDVLIPPMILLPLVENSFKHGIKADVTETFVHINLSTKDHEITFEIENNKGRTDSIKEKTEGGIGIENIRQRLNILYPDKHSFEISENDHIFKVTLKLQNENELHSG